MNYELKNKKVTFFLTSSPTLGWAGDLNPANGFLDELRRALPHPIRCLLISSYPDDQQITDRMAWEMREIFEHADLAFDRYEVLDRRTQRFVARMMRDANFIILCGGHVPTENRFFHELRLRQRMQHFDGVVMGISAGSMNAAHTVYSSPELEGESIDPDYKLFMRGLGLTRINILPHFQTLHDAMLDGRRLVDDIIASHSFGHPVYCLPDGSYFLITIPQVSGLHEGIAPTVRTELRGEAYRMLDGKLTQISQEGDRKLFCRDGRLRRL